ncbi:MAG: hypothetical protein R2716_09725 [Microthrixaceae bacterium]
MFAALADPTPRRSIVRRLADGEATLGWQAVHDQPSGGLAAT